jgi:hypothetical protein
MTFDGVGVGSGVVSVGWGVDGGCVSSLKIRFGIPDDCTRNTFARIPRFQTFFVATLSQIIAIVVYDQTATNDTVFSP